MDGIMFDYALMDIGGDQNSGAADSDMTLVESCVEKLILSDFYIA